MDVYQLNKLSLNLPFQLAIFLSLLYSYFPTDKEEKGLNSKQSNSRVKDALQDLDIQNLCAWRYFSSNKNLTFLSQYYLIEHNNPVHMEIPSTQSARW